MADLVTGLMDLCTRTVRDVLGITVSYTPAATGVPVTIVAPFDEAYLEILVASSEGITSEEPVLDVRIADLPSMPVQGDALTLTRPSTGTTTTYRVDDVRLGGQGTGKLYLSIAGA